MSGTSLGPPTDLPGFFGKIPSVGDFVSKRVPISFVEPWDEWLQRGLVESQEEFGDVWLDLYLHGPIWRFLLPRGLLGQDAWIGILMPSMDKGGRHFPFTIASPVEYARGPLVTLGSAEAWFDALEELALSVLDDSLEIDTLDERLLCTPLAAYTRFVVDVAHRNALGWQLSGEPNSSPTMLLLNLADRITEREFAQTSFWTTAGSKYVKPTLFTCSMMPSAHVFAALLDGDITRWR